MRSGIQTEVLSKCIFIHLLPPLHVFPLSQLIFPVVKGLQPEPLSNNEGIRQKVFPPNAALHICPTGHESPSVHSDPIPLGPESDDTHLDVELSQ